MKLSETQKRVIGILRKYENEIVMYDGWLTGGHGIGFEMRTIRALEKKGIISNKRISDLGKKIDIS